MMLLFKRLRPAPPPVHTPGFCWGIPPSNSAGRRPYHAPACVNAGAACDGLVPVTGVGHWR
jgi:hypothetical protein